MNILALETSMGACGAAVLRDDGETRHLVTREARMARGHAEALMPMVAAAMDEAGLGFASLDLIAATRGPGSFTGVRIAIAAARALALVTPAKLWGTDSLTVMARSALARSVLARGGLERGQPFAVAVDARASSLYFGLYDGDGRNSAGPLLLSVDEAAAMLPDDVAIVVGNGASLLAAAAPSLSARLLDLEPDVAALAELAREAGETLPSLRPLYLRPPDAKPQASPGVLRR